MAIATNSVTNVEAHSYYQALQPYILLIVGGLVGYWFGRRHEAVMRVRRAKDEFLAVIAAQRAKLAGSKDKEPEFFEQSLPVFREAVYRIQHFLSAEQWSRLHAILKEYQSHRRHGFEPGQIALALIARGIARDLGTGSVRATPDELLREYLERFAECVHGST
jgi:hypothetical protein